MRIVQIPSPNYGPELINPKIIIVHSTVGSFASALSELTRKDDTPVSAHYLIDRVANVPNENALIAQLVPLTMQAWGAGMSEWRTYGKYCNHYAVQIELANRSDDIHNIHEPYPEIQTGACVELINMLCRKFAIMPGRNTVVSHADVALPKGRKRDPIFFDMDMLRARVLELYNA